MFLGLPQTNEKAYFSSYDSPFSGEKIKSLVKGTKETWATSAILCEKHVTNGCTVQTSGDCVYSGIYKQCDTDEYAQEEKVQYLEWQGMHSSETLKMWLHF